MFEFARITQTYMREGVLMCDLLPPRTNAVYEAVPIVTQHSSVLPVPKEGDLAIVAKLTDRKRVVLGTTHGEKVMEPDNPVPSSVRDGELRFRFDENTQLAFLKRDDGKHDLHLKASGDIHIEAEGDVIIEGTNFEEMNSTFNEHTHNYDADESDRNEKIQTTEPPDETLQTTETTSNG